MDNDIYHPYFLIKPMIMKAAIDEMDEVSRRQIKRGLRNAAIFVLLVILAVAILR